MIEIPKESLNGFANESLKAKAQASLANSAERLMDLLAALFGPKPAAEPAKVQILEKVYRLGEEMFRTDSGLTLVPLAKICAFADCSRSLTDFREILSELRKEAAR